MGGQDCVLQQQSGQDQQINSKRYSRLHTHIHGNTSVETHPRTHARARARTQPQTYLLHPRAIDGHTWGETLFIGRCAKARASGRGPHLASALAQYAKDLGLGLDCHRFVLLLSFLPAAGLGSDCVFWDRRNVPQPCLFFLQILMRLDAFLLAFNHHFIYLFIFLCILCFPPQLEEFRGS